MATPHPIPNDCRFKDLTGTKIGRFEILFYLGNKRWWIRCECGRERAMGRRGIDKNKGCGCLANKGAPITHGKSGTPEFYAWGSMKDRCLNPRSAGFHNYGGRGITVCKRWLGSFENFLADMGPRPSPKHSLNRINNDLGYCPENCEWASHVVQANNTRHTMRIAFRGKTQSVADWARELGINHRTLYSRIVKSGMSIERALQPIWYDRRKRTG